MRQPKRIPIILKALKEKENKKRLLKYWFTNSPIDDIDGIITVWESAEKQIEEFWKDNTDLRLPQVLINAGIMPNHAGFYYFIEDEDSMITSGVLIPEEILFWGNNYDKDNNRLPETIWVQVGDMTKGHLEAIVDLYDLGKMKVSEVYIEMFKKELKKREE